MASPGPEPMATDEEYLEAVRARPEPFATASDVAERVGCTRQNAHKHLDRLAGDGRIKKKKIGANAVVWWVD